MKLKIISTKKGKPIKNDTVIMKDYREIESCMKCKHLNRSYQYCKVDKQKITFHEWKLYVCDWFDIIPRLERSGD